MPLRDMSQLHDQKTLVHMLENEEVNMFLLIASSRARDIQHKSS